ncbi:MAG: HEAT repeat domain-containing protein [Candidatus Kryptoniota bacterium]
MYCWNEVPEKQILCPHCGKSLDDIERLDYDDKLIAALFHFEPQTPIRAAELLAARKTRKAVPEILRAYCSRPDLDPYMARAFIHAISQIEGKPISSVCQEIIKEDNFKSEVAKIILQSFLITK